MANLPLSFAELLAGGLLAVAGATGDHLQDIIAGNITLNAFTGAGSAATPTSTATASGGSSAGAGNAPSGGVGEVTPSMLSRIGGSHGWSASQLGFWKLVINRESGGSTTARNSSSGAYGIAQFIDGPSEYAQYGGDVNTAEGQVTAMANYIAQRYGTPQAAWAHEESAGWY